MPENYEFSIEKLNHLLESVIFLEKSLSDSSLPKPDDFELQGHIERIDDSQQVRRRINKESSTGLMRAPSLYDLVERVINRYDPYGI